VSAGRVGSPGDRGVRAAVSSRSSDNAWLFRPAPRPDAGVRLFCFPYAGAGASTYRAWPEHVPDSVEICAVQLPGREGRLREAPFTRFRDLVEAAAGALEPHFGRPFALFGHSMGALVAFEVARALAARGGAMPLHLFVSGRRAPQLPRRRPPIAHLAHDAFVAEVRRRYDGIPEEVFRTSELMELLVPTLRADITALEGHAHMAGPPLSCPITAYGSSDDPEATETEIAAWREHSTGNFRYLIFPGTHFFVQTSRALLAADVVQALGGLAGGTIGTELRSRDQTGA